MPEIDDIFVKCVTNKLAAIITSCLWIISCTAALAASNDNNIDTTELFHDQASSFCEPLEPGINQPISISIRCLQNDITSARLKYFDEADNDYHMLEMKKLHSHSASNSNSRFELWQAIVPASKSRKHYRFLLRDGSATASYNAAGAHDSEMDDFDFMLNPGFTTPKWLSNGVMYQIFPDRFFDGNSSNNIRTNQYTFSGSKTLQRNWGESPIPKEGENGALIFYGGDLQGIKDKVSYIRETLGANIIYLNPIFESPSNHKYDTSDYLRVAKCLGSTHDLTELTEALHKEVAGQRGYLILDAVFNHTGDSHTWFAKNKYVETQYKEKGAYESKSSPFFSYYSFSNWPNKYATFLDVKDLPKLNYGSPELKNAIFNSKDSVALHYLNAPFKIDGWRLDAPQYADKDGKDGSDNYNHEVWREFRKAIKSKHPEAAIMGENWQDASTWVSRGDQWDTVTNFNGFTQPVSEWITGRNYDDKPAQMSAVEFERWLRLTRAIYPGNAQRCLSNHLGNHDITRFAQRANGDAAKISLALAFQMTYVGVPTLYYGDEYGMQGGKDPDDRRTFDWSLNANNNELIAYTHKLIELRKKNSALRDGAFITLDVQNQDNIFAYGRMDQTNRVAVVLNGDKVAHETRVSIYKLDIPDGTTVKDALSDSSYTVKDGSVSFSLKGHTAAILVR